MDKEGTRRASKHRVLWNMEGTIYTWRKIFLQLSFALILPLYFVYFAQTEINKLLTQNMMQTLTALQVNDDPTLTIMNTRSLLRELPWYLLIQVSFIVFFFVFSLISKSVVIYTIECIYVCKKVTFKEPSSSSPSSENLLPGAILSILYLAGVCHMGVVWQLANTVSVLEESCGFQALRKSKILMKGKMGISVGIFLVINICVGDRLAMHLFNNFVVFDLSKVGMVGRVGFGLLLCIINLGFVVQTVFYLACKSYQHEQIDKSALADHLEVNHGEGYVLLKPKGSDMEQV
ncbi:hypothetical protein V2J09_021897 [Rumex salicifolius]